MKSFGNGWDLQTRPPSKLFSKTTDFDISYFSHISIVCNELVTTDNKIYSYWQKEIRTDYTLLSNIRPCINDSLNKMCVCFIPN